MNTSLNCTDTCAVSEVTEEAMQVSLGTFVMGVVFYCLSLLL